MNLSWLTSHKKQLNWQVSIIASFLAGGTNQIDLMKEAIYQPDRVVDIAALNLRGIEDRGDTIRYGALVTNTAAAEHVLTRQHAPLIAMTIVKGATQQIRNTATLGGNLLQGVRCPYFYKKATRCNRRDRQGGCDAIGGYDPLNLQSPAGTRTMAFKDLHR